MLKFVIAGATALAIAGTSFAYAQQPDRRDGRERSQPSADDLRAFGEARLAALKAGLMLTPDQERNWPAFEQAAREFAKQRVERRMAMRDLSPSDDFVEHTRRRAVAMSEIGAALKKLSDAAEPLYKSLDETQKRRFAVLNRLTDGDGGHFRSHDRDRSRGRGDRREGRLERFGDQHL